MVQTILNLKPLIALQKAFKGSKPPIIQVGIPSDHASRSGGQADNATIGAIHEFGTSKIPQRSFLRMPINKELPKRLDQKSAFDEKTLRDVVKTGSFRPVADVVAQMCLGVVHDAFASGGFGDWPPDKDGQHSPLVETGQLRDSIIAEVKE